MLAGVGGSEDHRVLTGCWGVADLYQEDRSQEAHWEQESLTLELAETIQGFLYSNGHKCAFKDMEHPVTLFTDQRTVSNQLGLLPAGFHDVGSISSPLPTSPCWGGDGQWCSGVGMLMVRKLSGKGARWWLLILISDNNTKWGFTRVAWHAPSFWELQRTNCLFGGSHVPIYWPRHTWITIKPPC